MDFRRSGTRRITPVVEGAGEERFARLSVRVGARSGIGADDRPQDGAGEGEPTAALP